MEQLEVTRSGGNINVSLQIRRFAARGHLRRSRTAGTLQAGLTNWTLFCLPPQGIFVCLGLGCFATSLVSTVFNHRKIIHGHVEKNHFSFGNTNTPAVLWYFPRDSHQGKLHLNNTVCLADFKRLWYKRLFNFIFFSCKDIKCYWYYVWINSNCNRSFQMKDGWMQFNM